MSIPELHLRFKVSVPEPEVMICRMVDFASWRFASTPPPDWGEWIVYVRFPESYGYTLLSGQLLGQARMSERQLFEMAYEDAVDAALR